MTITEANRISLEAAVHRIIGMARRAVERVIAELNDPNEQGGYFCLVERREDSMTLPTLILGVGTVPVEKGPKYLAFAQEKARRLAECPDHVSSWQSRNPEENKWGGAISAYPYILSFSGLPEHGDEAAMLLAALYLRLMTIDQASWIASHSANQLFNKVRIHFPPPPR